MTAPTVVIVPGFWLGPRPYDLFVEELRKTAPFLTYIMFSELRSTGTRSPGAPNMLNDAMGIRAVIKLLVEAGKRVVLIGQSSGAFVSAMATEDLEVGQRLAVPSGGGVEKLIFIAGGILPGGSPHPPTNWGQKDGASWIVDADQSLFFDVDPDIAEKYCKPFIKSQPLMEDWNLECTYSGWEKVPSHYILAEHDRVIPPEVQEMCAGLAKSEIIRIPTGHMSMLSEPKMLSEKVASCVLGNIHHSQTGFEQAFRNRNITFFHRSHSDSDLGTRYVGLIEAWRWRLFESVDIIIDENRIIAANPSS